MIKNITKEYLSDCHNARLKSLPRNIFGYHHDGVVMEHICGKCGKPCQVISKKELAGAVMFLMN